MKVIVLMCLFTVSVLSVKNTIEIFENCMTKSFVGNEDFFEILKPPGLSFFESKNRAQKCFVACYYNKMEIVS